jgi:hypothetical protein
MRACMQLLAWHGCALPFRLPSPPRWMPPQAKLVCKEDVQDVQAEVAIMNLVAGHQNVVTLKVGARPQLTVQGPRYLLEKKGGQGGWDL